MEGRGRQMDVSPASSRSSSGWFAVLQDDLIHAVHARMGTELPFLAAESEGTCDTADVTPDTSFPTEKFEPPEYLTAPNVMQQVVVEHYTEQMEMSRENMNEKHMRGRCDPCVFYTSIGCRMGKNCPYCHQAHGEPKATHRPRKQTRDKYKADLQELLLRFEGRLDHIHAELQGEARKNPYVRKLLQGYLDGQVGKLFEVPVAQAGLSPALPAHLPPNAMSMPEGRSKELDLYFQRPRVVPPPPPLHAPYLSAATQTRYAPLGYAPPQSSSSALGLLVDVGL